MRSLAAQAHEVRAVETEGLSPTAVGRKVDGSPSSDGPVSEGPLADFAR